MSEGPFALSSIILTGMAISRSSASRRTASASSRPSSFVGSPLRHHRASTLSSFVWPTHISLGPAKAWNFTWNCEITPATLGAFVGKTALKDWLCKRMRARFELVAITNDIYTREDA